MQVAILTEGFKHTGYGHIFRCQAIAESFCKRDIEVIFIINGDEQLKDILTGYTVYLFPWMNELSRLKQLLENTDIALVDSYHAGKKAYEAIRNEVSACGYMDDYNRLEYPPGILINGTVGADKIYEKKDPGLRYLIGGEYVILREPFRLLPPRTKITPSVNTILITFGGSDPLQLTPVIMSKIVEYSPDSNKIIILGPAFKNVGEVERAADIHTKFYHNIDAETMKLLMSQSDIAISAAGQTMNELAATGLPSIIFKVADNQKFNISGWIETGFINSFLDAMKGWTEGDLKNSLQQMESPEYRTERSLAGHKVLDGKGTDRIVKEMLREYGMNNLHIRLADRNDLPDLFELANEKEVRANSFSTKAISLEEHTNWFNRSLENPLRKLFVFHLKNDLIGQVRFDREDEVAVISISLNARYRGMGLASFMIREALKAYRKEVFSVTVVYAYVKETNKASQYTFLNAGFKTCASELNEVLKYLYEYRK